MITIVEYASHFWDQLLYLRLFQTCCNLKNGLATQHLLFQEIIGHQALLLLFYEEFHGLTHYCQTLNLLFCRRTWFALLVKASVLPLENSRTIGSQPSSNSETKRLFVPVQHINILKSCTFPSSKAPMYFLCHFIWWIPKSSFRNYVNNSYFNFTSISSSINLSINDFVRHSLLNNLHPF